MLDEFLKDNSSLFVITGFFMALAGYLSNRLPEGNEKNILINLGVVSCIAISVLISFIILIKLFPDLKNPNSINITEYNLENIERFLFAVPFFSIITVLIAFVYQNFSLETNLIVALVFCMVAIPLYFQVFKIKVFNEHLYLGSALILVTSGVINYYLIESYKNINLYIVPLQFALSTFANMSLLVILITLFKDAIKFIKNFKKHVTDLKNKVKHMLTKIKN